jgi:glycosyltransferase involved in cell wall biosynthesis
MTRPESTIRPAGRNGRSGENLRILLVSADSIAPGPTGSGNRAIRWGLLQGLDHAGALTAYYSAAHAGKHRGDFTAVRDELSLGNDRFWFDRPADGDDAIKALRCAIGHFEPDIILAYGTNALKLARKAAPDICTGIMSVDLEYMPNLYRHWYNLRHGRVKQKVKSFLLTPAQAMFAFAAWREVRVGYKAADFILNHAANHAKWHAAAHGLPVLYTPNPVARLPHVPRRTMPKTPRFMLLGGIGGIATLTGLAWFAREVYPLIEPSIIRDQLEIHLIGRGEMDASIAKRMPKIVRRGFVEDLTKEFEEATALLVPTQIELGFRTRVLDAFRHGVTVVAHRANSIGMPELIDGKNALVARNAQEFADKVQQLVRDNNEAQRLGAAALDDFDRFLNGDIVATRVVTFVKEVLHNVSKEKVKRLCLG